MRRKDREITDIQTIKKILDGGSVMHIALNNGTYPYILPVNYGYKFDGDKLNCFSTAPKRAASTRLSKMTATLHLKLNARPNLCPLWAKRPAPQAMHMQASSVRALLRQFPKGKRKNILPHLWHISASAQQNSIPLILQTQKCTG